MTDKEIMEYDLKYWIMPERVFIQNMNITNYDEAQADNGGEFEISYNDWKNPAFGSEQYIWRIIGTEWLLKYKNEDRDSYFTSDNEPALVGSIAMFVISLANFVAALILQLTGLSGVTGLSYFALIGMTLTHELVYLPLAVVFLMQAFGGYEQIIQYVYIFDLSVYATTYGIPFWAAMIFLFFWFFPAFNVDTGFNANGGEAFGAFLAYALCGGGDMAAGILLTPVFAVWKELTLEEQAE